MKKYIGTVSEYTGIVRMLNTRNALVPHYLGGANSGEEDLFFVSYEVERINKKFLEKHGLRFLTEEEVAHFFRGEDINGNPIEKPVAPKMTEQEKAEMKKLIEETIKDYEAEGKDTKFLKEMLSKY